MLFYLVQNDDDEYWRSPGVGVWRRISEHPLGGGEYEDVELMVGQIGIVLRVLGVHVEAAIDGVMYLIQSNQLEAV